MGEDEQYLMLSVELIWNGWFGAVADGECGADVGEGEEFSMVSVKQSWVRWSTTQWWGRAEGKYVQLLARSDIKYNTNCQNETDVLWRLTYDYLQNALLLLVAFSEGEQLFIFMPPNPMKAVCKVGIITGLL